MFKCAKLKDKIYICIECVKEQKHHPREAESYKMNSEDCIEVWKIRF
jgi:hypothetical protein